MSEQRPMEMKKGIAVSPGIVIREAFILDIEEIRIPQRFVEKELVEEEAERFEQAITIAATSLDQDIQQLGSEIEINSQILHVHKSLLSDPVLKNEILNHIQSNQYTAEHAVSRVMNRYIKKFEESDSAIISDRVHDLYDVEKRMLSTLLGSRLETIDKLESEIVIIAKNLTPTQTSKLDPQHVRGFATEMGGKTSHTAIMARALGIPAVVAVENIATSAVGGDVVIIDGFRGVVIINPDARVLAEYQEKEKNIKRIAKRMRKEAKLPAETLDGYEIQVMANIELSNEVHAASDLGAGGIGLFRTEFIQLQNQRAGEEAHFQHYQLVLKELSGKPITIRTLDLGADKSMDLRGSAEEENPFLGCRSIRYCFAHPELFRAQLRAILRASAFGHVRMMLPMITAVQELDQAFIMIEQVKRELRDEKLAFDEDIEVGIMVEVASAAIIADLLAPMVSFYSIGTNDLVQYTLAVDRGNQLVASLYDPVHPAVLRLLEKIIKVGKEQLIPVNICGEMASEPLYIPLLIGLGVRSLSVSPTAIPEVKRIIRSIKAYECQALAKSCQAYVDGGNISYELAKWGKTHLPDTGRSW